MIEPILVSTGLTKSFGGFIAVNNIDLTVRRGSVHALIGPNGAGKTTVFNMLTKFVQPTVGSLWFDERDITKATPASVARMGLVRSFQISAIFPKFSVRDNVELALMQRRGGTFAFWRSRQIPEDARRRTEELLDVVGIAPFAEQIAGTLSYGRKRALELATTLALDPKLLLLDEPMAGLGREDIGTISNVIKSVALGRTILMVEHNLSVVAELAQTITVLARGEILAEGDYATVSNDPRVIEAYLGNDNG